MPPPTPVIVVAGTNSGVGKTTVACGLMKAFKEAGLRVQPFKVGPDFLDGMHHAAALGGGAAASVNLDGWMMGREGCLEAFHHAMRASSADLAIVEGCMGLHDGRDGCSDEGSTAQVAKWLGAPVLLVLDCWSLARSAAAMVHGFKTFDPEVRLAGVLLNRVAGASHAAWLREAMASASSTATVAVLGCLPSDKRVETPERLLGLLPPPSSSSSSSFPSGTTKNARLAALHTLMTEHVDLTTLQALAATATTPPLAPPPLPRSVAQVTGSEDESSSLPPVRIAVARDEAFCFIYQDNLRLLRDAGATLVFFSPLRDRALPPDIDGLYLVGGYPELHARELAANTDMHAAVQAFAQRGGFVWAECGGLMYLAKKLYLRPADVQTAKVAAEAAERPPPPDRLEEAPASLPSDPSDSLVHEMCGLLPFDVTMTPRMAMGYCTARLRGPTAKLLGLPPGTAVRCQQYHFSEATVPGGGEPAVMVDQTTGGGAGIKGIEVHAFDVRMEAPNALESPEGALLCGGRTVATYCHVHLGSDPRLASAFVRAARFGQRVVSLTPAATEMLALLFGVRNRARQRLLGVSEHCDYPRWMVEGLHKVSKSAVDLREGMSGAEVDSALKKAKQDGGLTSAHVLDVDWLAMRRPGLVLTQDSCAVCDATVGTVRGALEAAGLDPRCALTLAPVTVDQVFRAMRQLGAALGLPEEETEAVVGPLEARLATVAAAVHQSREEERDGASRLQRPRVLGLESVCPLVASGMWLPDMRLRAGGIDALEGAFPGCPARLVGPTEIEACGADFVVLCCCGRSALGAAEEAKALLACEGTWALPALQARPMTQFFVVGHENFSRPGPRVVDGIETMSALLLLPSDAGALLPTDPVVRVSLKGVLRLVVEDEDDEEIQAEGGRGKKPRGKPKSWRFESVLPEDESNPASSTAPLHAPPNHGVPPVRCASALVATDSHGLLVFGGEVAVSSEDSATGRPLAVQRLADVWTLDPPTKAGKWEACSAPSPTWRGPWACGVTAFEEVPTPRSNHAAVACGDHLLVFGGWSADGATPLSHPELLHLDTRCWTHCSTVNAAPPPRGNPTLVYSPYRHLAILYGGWNKATRLGDVWCLDMESWTWHSGPPSPDTDIATPGEEATPRARTDHDSALWRASPQEERMLVFGGSTSSGSSDELWSLDCSGGAPHEWSWRDEKENAAMTLGGKGPWPPARTSHAIAVAGSGASASLVVVGGQDGALGLGAAAIVADAWVLSPLGGLWGGDPTADHPRLGFSATWTRLEWNGIYPLLRCRHSMVIQGGLAIVYGGYDGINILDEHHSLFAAPVTPAAAAGKEDNTAARAAGGEVEAAVAVKRLQERWEAERPLTEADLPPEARAKASKSTVPLAMAKALHRHAVNSCAPPRDTYIDPSSGYSVFTQAYLKRRPCCGNSCRHCPWGHANVPGNARKGKAEDVEDVEDVARQMLDSARS
ncbi:unnamed protein product [Polarella glacialis]|uniref:Cobyrinic acid a,c-diamide synthase n=1 Tax=Polarella glacialis TaxID=89957 RepID=A0A813JRT8_POLGL|nr:unnamed protein product [Polarella glacialis]